MSYYLVEAKKPRNNLSRDGARFLNLADFNHIADVIPVNHLVYAYEALSRDASVGSLE